MKLGCREQDAIDLVNDSPYGLGGSVLTQDTKRGFEVAKQISHRQENSSLNHLISLKLSFSETPARQIILRF
ncbi:aldehyde dehydrogenase family protein [Acetobacter farinalis]|nr:aldehyde dehydrogenase family protein [Acetobacter farinalis]